MVTHEEWPSSSSDSLDSDMKHWARRVFDKIDDSDPHMMCYTTSKNASTYIPIDKDFFNGISDCLIAGFGQEHSKDRKLQVRKLITEVMSYKLSRVRAHYNSINGNTSSEKAAKWMREEIAKEDGELKECQLTLSHASKTSHWLEDLPQKDKKLIDSSIKCLQLQWERGVA